MTGAEFVSSGQFITLNQILANFTRNFHTQENCFSALGKFSFLYFSWNFQFFQLFLSSRLRLSTSIAGECKRWTDGSTHVIYSKHHHKSEVKSFSSHFFCCCSPLISQQILQFKYSTISRIIIVRTYMWGKAWRMCSRFENTARSRRRKWANLLPSIVRERRKFSRSKIVHRRGVKNNRVRKNVWGLVDHLLTSSPHLLSNFTRWCFHSRSEARISPMSFRNCSEWKATRRTND